LRAATPSAIASNSRSSIAPIHSAWRVEESSAAEPVGVERAVEVFAIGTATPIAALFDGVSEEQIQRLRRNAEYRRTARGRTDELASVASIIDVEHIRGREIEILTVGVPDILDLLDESAVREAARRHHRHRRSLDTGRRERRSPHPAEATQQPSSSSSETGMASSHRSRA
jgi:hypothetical protein